MIRFYLGEEPILQNVPTWMCRKPDDLRYVLDHLHELVVKEVHGAGGYGMLIGPAATRAEIEAFRAAVIANPTATSPSPRSASPAAPPMWTAALPAHIDLRPFVLSGQKVQMVAGGLPRGLRRDRWWSIHRKGGAPRDTWVLGDQPAAAQASPLLQTQSQGGNDHAEPYCRSFVLDGPLHRRAESPP